MTRDPFSLHEQPMNGSGLSSASGCSLSTSSIYGCGATQSMRDFDRLSGLGVLRSS